MVSCFQDIWFHFNHFFKGQQYQRVHNADSCLVCFSFCQQFDSQCGHWSQYQLSSGVFMSMEPIVTWQVHLTALYFPMMIVHGYKYVRRFFQRYVDRTQNLKTVQIYFTTIFCFITLCQAKPQKVKTVLYFCMRLGKLSNDNFCQARNCSICLRLYVAIEPSQGLQ